MTATTVRYFQATATRASSILLQSLAAHAGLGLLVLVHTIAALTLSLWTDGELNFQMVGMASYFAVANIPIFAITMLVFAVVRMAVCDKPKSPVRHLIGQAKHFATDVPRLVDGAVVLFLVFIFMASFSFIKDSIPSLNPFSWDQAFAALDRAIFLGNDPWRLTFSIFGSPIATSVLNFLYNIWFFVMYVLILSMAFCRTAPESRYTFLYAFFLAWSIGGNLLAVLLSSAGPVYFSRLGLGTEYDPHLALLNEYAQVLPVWALSAQDQLWDAYLNGNGAISGISAMPSMHVTSSVLFALLGFRIHRVLGQVLTIFSVSIVVGSVHLGWHYFVDGVLGCVVAFFCWYGASILAQNDLKRLVRPSRPL